MIGLFKAGIGVWAAAGGAALTAPVWGSASGSRILMFEICAIVIEQTVGLGRHLGATEGREELGIMLFRRKGEKPVSPIL
jgi:hypothetical protein